MGDPLSELKQRSRELVRRLHDSPEFTAIQRHAIIDAIYHQVSNIHGKALTDRQYVDGLRDLQRLVASALGDDG
jgi:hypothetical protein